MSDYWLHPTIPPATSQGRTMATVNVPPTREHPQSYSWLWPIVPKQKHAVHDFAVNENARLASVKHSCPQEQR